MEEEKVISVLKVKFGEDVLSIEQSRDFLTITVNNTNITAIIQYLYDHPETQFQYLTTLCGIHYADEKQIAIMYQLHNLVSNERIRIKTFLPEENPRIQSITSVFAGANWMERETYDFYGVQFEGHPDLRRILNVDEMIMFPMRKEFPLEDQTREDKNDFMFGR
jgi:NADH-quinone oxidoreductase subunit C